jgi:hypothetical protein
MSNSCRHENLIKAKKGSEFSFCKNCSCLLVNLEGKTIFTLKNVECNLEYDWSMLGMFEIIKQQKLKKISSNQTYLAVRKDAINYMKRFIQKYKFTESTFYLSLFYMDLILKNKNNITEQKVDLIVISSVLLACNF